MGERKGLLQRFRRWRETVKRERIEDCPNGHVLIYVGRPSGPKCDHCGEPRERTPTESEWENW